MTRDLWVMSSTLVLGKKRLFCSVLEGRLKPPAFQFQPSFQDYDHR